MRLVRDRAVHGLEAVQALDLDDRSLVDLALVLNHDVDVRLEANVAAPHHRLGDAEEPADVA